jgi:hypothetical protein
MLIARLELTFLFQSVLDILRRFCLLFLLEGSGIPANLTTVVSWVVKVQGAVTLLKFVYMSLTHRDRKGEQRTTYLEEA